MFQCPSFENFALLFLCSFYVLVHESLGHPVNNPGSFSLAQVTQFPFYEKLGNPCGFSKGIEGQDKIELTTGIDSDSTSAFTEQFLMDMMTALNLTKGTLDNLQDVIKDTPDCTGISLNSIPETPSMEMMNEFNTMRTIYRSGIYLIAHLHIVSLDRETVDDLNEVTDYESPHSIASSFSSAYYFLCGNEPRSFIPIVEQLTRRIEDLLCTLVSGASLKQRASFRSQLEQLEATRIFRYHSSCSSMQMRDCIVFLEVRKVFKNLEKKFSKLVNLLSLRKARAERRSSTTTTINPTPFQLHEIDNNNI